MLGKSELYICTLSIYKCIYIKIGYISRSSPTFNGLLIEIQRPVTKPMPKQVAKLIIQNVIVDIWHFVAKELFKNTAANCDTKQGS